MKLEDLKKMSLIDLERAKVIVIIECPNCPSFHGTFDIPNCGRNNSMILDTDKDGFSTECELFDVSQLVEIWDKKRRVCTCERCMEKKYGRTRDEGFDELKE